MTRIPPGSQARRRIRLVALGAVFVVGAFFAQGDAADAQQIRYSTGTSSSVEVPPPMGATAVAGRVASSVNGADRVVPCWAVVPPPPLPMSSGTRLESRWSSAPARPPGQRLTTDRGPPSPVL